MDVNHKSSLYTLKKIRIFLVFFCSLLWVSCQKEIQNPKYRIDYSQGQKAYQISFEGSGSTQEYSVLLKGQTNAVLGDVLKEEENIVFRPVIPFSWDKEYEIYKNGDFYMEFTVRAPENVIRPKLLGIYPKLDTLPENLLKMYFEFDQPMQQSRSSLEYIKVFNLTKGGEVDIFLPLENELWNREKTRLTLWLDPGRIKKDLIPNKKRGVPIEEGNQYELIVERHFSGGDYGADLGKPSIKRFYVHRRDRESPVINQWKLTVPKSNTKEGLGIDFKESLDYFLIQETIRAFKGKEELGGAFFVSKKGNSVVFIPEGPWQKGTYSIHIESRLEDLAGNNLNRLFDVDLENRGEVDNSEFKVLEFVVE